MSSTKVYDYDSDSDRITSPGTIDKSDYYYFVLNTNKYSSVTITWDSNNEYDAKKLSSEDCFALITIKGDTSGSVSGIDDL